MTDAAGGTSLGDRAAGAVGLVALAAGLAKGAAVALDGPKGPAEPEPGSEAPEDVAPDPAPSGLLGRFDRVPVIGRALAVHRRYGELNGGQLSAALAFQVFTALLPLLLLAVAVVGFLAGSGTDVAARIVGELGLNGDAATAIRDAVDAARTSRKAATIVGLAGLLWTSLGLVGAFQTTFDQAWQVEPRGLKDKAWGALWLGGAAVLFVGASVVSTAVRWLPGYFAPLGIGVGLAVNLALWLWTFRVLPNTRLPWRTTLPGAILGAVGLEVLKVVGAIYVPRAVSNSSQLYGSLGVVLALLAWLYIFGRLVVYATVLNVVLHERRAGTVRATIEIPRQPGADATDDVNRGGSVERADMAS